VRRAAPAASPRVLLASFQNPLRDARAAPSKRERATVSCFPADMGYRRKRRFLSSVASECLRWRCARKCIPLSLSLSLFLFLPHTHTLFLSAFPVDAERQLLDDARTRVRRPRFRFPHVTGDRSESRGQLEVLTPRMQPRTRRSATHTCANTTLDCATSIPLARGLPRRRPVKVERLNAGTRTGESLATGRSSRAMSTVLLGCARTRRRCRRRRRRRRRRR